MMMDFSVAKNSTVEPSCPREALGSDSSTSRATGSSELRSCGDFIFPSALDPEAVSSHHPQHDYTPQFSAATSFVLRRMKGEVSFTEESPLAGFPNSVIMPDKHAFEETKARLIQGLNTTRSHPSPFSSSMLPAKVTEIDYRRAGTKRKRDDKRDAEDFTQNTIACPPSLLHAVLPAERTASPKIKSETPLASPFAADVTLSAEHHGSRSSMVRRCAVCHRSVSGSEERTVTCGLCAVTYHFHCVALTKSSRDAYDSSYVCGDCRGYNKAAAQVTEEWRAQRLARLPSDVLLPPNTKLIGFEGGQASDFAVRPICRFYK